MSFPRLGCLTHDDRWSLIDGVRRLMSDSRDWTRSRPRQLNAEVFADEIKSNRRVRGWIRAGNIWLDGRLSVRDPYGTTDVRLHACDKLYNAGGEYCEILGHYGCDECWRMTQRKCAEADLPNVSYDTALAYDRPLSAPWKVIAGRRRAMQTRARSAASEVSSSVASSKLDKILNETNIREKLLEEKRNSVFLTETPEKEDIQAERVKSASRKHSNARERFVFRNDLRLMCPPLMSINQARADSYE